MKIFITKGDSSDWSAYYAEILHASGLCFAHRHPLSEIAKMANPQCDVILLTQNHEAQAVEPFLQQGGSVVAILPDDSLEKLAGIVRKEETGGPWNLRFAQPICYGSRGEPLWTLGPIRVYEPKPGSNTLAYFSHPRDPRSDTIGILECPVGKGTLTLYAYDPAKCIAMLRQGDASRANALPPGERTPRVAFLQEPNLPTHTFWRPTADLHAFALAEVMQRNLQRSGPVPGLWHLPEGKPSVLIFSGDEDNSAQSANDQQMRDLESAGGAMTLYIIPDLTSITRPLIEEYTRRGHAISVHPNLVPTAAESPEIQLAEAEKQVRLFQEKFQWPVRTVRNHFYMWPGYLELPELWERFGIGMDANTCATLHFQSLDYGPFISNHAAIPLPFVRDNGDIIDVYQQPTHVNDDLQMHPEKFYSQKFSVEQFDRIIERIFDESMRFFHSPLCVNVHPVNYVSFSGPHSRNLMAKAKELDLPIWSLDRWHDFWRDRSSWRMSEYTWDGSLLQFTLEGLTCNSLWVTLPPAYAKRSVRDVLIDGNTVSAESVQRYGTLMVQVPLPGGASKVTIAARY